MVVASYGIPGYGSPRPYQTPGADFHSNAARPSETIANPNFDDRSPQLDLQWNYGAPADYQTPKSYRAPRAYGPGTTSTELGQEGLTAEVVQELDGGDGNGGGGGRGDENGGSGGGRGDGSGGSEGEGDETKKKSGLSMSQKLTLAYAILVGGLLLSLTPSLAC